MTTTELTKTLSQRMQVSQREARELLRLLCDTITRSLTHKETVIVRGFGSFGIRRRAARKSYNPAARRHMLLPPKDLIFFRPAERLKQLMAKRSKWS